MGLISRKFRVVPHGLDRWRIETSVLGLIWVPWYETIIDGGPPIDRVQTWGSQEAAISDVIQTLQAEMVAEKKQADHLQKIKTRKRRFPPRRII